VVGAQPNFFLTGKAIQALADEQLGPPAEGMTSRSQTLILRSLTTNTRGYIEKIANQANGAYEQGWFDAAAVMLRRLLETLIIETFESKGRSDLIKNNSGDFFYLRDLIDTAVAQDDWNLSRNCKKSMPRLKDVGDKSAHSRRYIAQRGDIDKLIEDIRVVFQELIFLSGIKK